jgi:hypothetical protein
MSTDIKEQLEYKILFGEEDYSHRKWFLQEVDANNKLVGQKQVPWYGQQIFTVCEFSYAHTVSVKWSLFEDEKDEEDVEDVEDVEDGEKIFARLIPGFQMDDKWKETTYSIFGTNRKIEDFSLSIWKLKENSENERCTIWGSARFSYEHGYRYHTDPDMVDISLFLSSQKFEKIKQLVIADASDVVRLNISLARGFYSGWHPGEVEVRDAIKILTEEAAHDLAIPDNCSIRPKGLGNVGKFELKIDKKIGPSYKSIDYMKEMRENIKNDEGPDMFDKLIDDLAEDAANEIHETVEESYVEKLLLQLQRNEKAVSALKIPIWAGIFLLLIIAIQIF